MFVYLFIYGVFNDAVISSDYHWIVGWLVNNQLKRMLKEAVLTVENHEHPQSGYLVFWARFEFEMYQVQNRSYSHFTTVFDILCICTVLLLEPIKFGEEVTGLSDIRVCVVWVRAYDICKFFVDTSCGWWRSFYFLRYVFNTFVNHSVVNCVPSDSYFFQAVLWKSWTLEYV
jgi:hypothetical protein